MNVECKLCKCGCGRILKSGSTYIHGHQGRGKPGHRTKGFSGRKHTTESKFRISEGCRGKGLGESNGMFTHYLNRWSLEKKARHSKIVSQITQSEETKVKKSQSVRSLWQDPEFREKQLLAIGRGLRIFPNKPETILLNLLNEMYYGEWKYTGDLSFIINGKNPDFVNINGKKLIIELFGDYWHQNEDPQKRIDVFKMYGWDTIVIWEHELEDMNNVVRKIKDFVGKEIRGG